MTSAPSPSLSEAWAVSGKHVGCYTGGKIGFCESSNILGCLCSEELHLVDAACQAPTRVVSQEGDGVLTFAIDRLGLHASGLLRHFSLGEKVALVRSWRGHDQVVADVCFDTTGALVATGSVDQTAKVWDFQGYFCTHNFKGHAGIVTLVRFHPARLQLVTLYFFTDRATTKDVVLLPTLCHDVALFSIALQVLLLVLILAYMLLKALLQRLASVLLARRVALEESAQEQAPKIRIELQPPCKCLRFAIKWDPDLRLMINTLKKEGEEGLTRFLENEVFLWKLRSYTCNKVSNAFRLNTKWDFMKRLQPREISARTAQKTAEQEMQDRRALRQLYGQADQAAAAQAPLMREQKPEDAGRGAHERLDYRTSKKKPMQMSTEEISAATSMVAGEAGSSSPEALQAEKNLNGEAADAFGQFRAEDSQKKRSGDAQMSFEDAAALALLTAEKPAGKTEAPQVETSGNTEAPQVETSATKDSACDTDGWDYDNFWAHIDVNLPPHLASAKIFAAMGISGDSAGITVAPAMPRSNMPNEDPFMGFWDKIDANMSPELVATKLLNAHFVKAY
eukprot:s2659_g8.t1